MTRAFLPRSANGRRFFRERLSLRGKSSTGRPVRQSDLGQRSPHKLLRGVVAQLLGRKA